MIVVLLCFQRNATTLRSGEVFASGGGEGGGVTLANYTSCMQLQLISVAAACLFHGAAWDRDGSAENTGLIFGSSLVPFPAEAREIFLLQS